MIAIVAAIRPSIVNRGVPAIHWRPPAPSGALNCSSCARKITIARPLTKPSITGWGTMRMNLPRCSTPARICSTPISTTAANMYWIP